MRASPGEGDPRSADRQVPSGDQTGDLVPAGQRIASKTRRSVARVSFCGRQAGERVSVGDDRQARGRTGYRYQGLIRQAAYAGPLSVRLVPVMGQDCRHVTEMGLLREL